MNKMYTEFIPQVKEVAGETGVYDVTINTSAKDRQGQTVLPSGAKLEAYMKNPVVMYGHNYNAFPVAKSLAIYPEGDNLTSRLQFPPKGISADADTAHGLWKTGFLNAASIGFMPLKWMREGHEGQREDLYQPDTIITEWELLEWSIVPVPANREALRRMFEACERAVIPYAKHGLADPAEAWDGPAEVAAADVAGLKIMCAWYDAEKPDSKSSYKLPHHKADGYATVWRAVAAAMAALLGGRGGVNIPDGDKQGVYNHLSKHYDDFGKPAPDFKAADEIITKEGRVISAKNRTRITDSLENISEAVKDIKALLDETEPANDTDQDIADNTDQGKTADDWPDPTLVAIYRHIARLREALT